MLNLALDSHRELPRLHHQIFTDFGLRTRRAVSAEAPYLKFDTMKLFLGREAFVIEALSAVRAATIEVVADVEGEPAIFNFFRTKFYILIAYSASHAYARAIAILIQLIKACGVKCFYLICIAKGENETFSTAVEFCSSLPRLQVKRTKFPTVFVFQEHHSAFVARDRIKKSVHRNSIIGHPVK